MNTIKKSLLVLAFGIMLGILSTSFSVETTSKSSAVSTTASEPKEAFLFVLEAKQGKLTSIKGKRNHFTLGAFNQ